MEDVEAVKKSISDTRNAAMRIGQAMYNQQSGQSQSQSQSEG